MSSHVGQYAFPDGATLASEIPKFDGYCENLDQFNEFIAIGHTALMPYYMNKKRIAFNSGLANRVTDNINLMYNNCHGELGAPTKYKCAPANNCKQEDLDVKKGIVKKDDTMVKTMCVDPMCDKAIAMELTNCKDYTTLAKMKMRLIADTFSKEENKIIFDLLSTTAGAAGSVNGGITSWEVDTAYEELSCLLRDIADQMDVDMSDLMIMTSNKTSHPINVMGYLIPDQTRNFSNGFFDYGNGFIGRFDGVPWYASSDFPEGKIFIGVKGAFTFWDSPMMYKKTDMDCNFGVNHIWAKEYGVFIPCDKAGKFGIWDLPEPCPKLDCDGNPVQ